MQTLHGQITGEQTVRGKTLPSILAASGEHKGKLVLLDGVNKYTVGDRLAVIGEFSSSKRFKAKITPTQPIEVQDDLNIIADMTGVVIPEEKYKEYLVALGTDNLFTASSLLQDSDTREDFFLKHPGSEEFVGLAFYVTTELDASGLAQLFRDAGTNLGFSHALQISYSLKNRQGYVNKSLLTLVSECPWIIAQVLGKKESEEAIEKLEKYLKIPSSKATIYRAANDVVLMLLERMRKGDCFVTSNELKKRIAYQLGYGEKTYNQAWELLTRKGADKQGFAGIVPDNDYLQESFKDAGRRLGKAKGAVYLPGIFFSERNAAIQYADIVKAPAKPLSYANMYAQFKAAENIFGKKLNNDQEEFIKTVCSNKVTILTGEAGTGKSYAIKVLAQSYHRLANQIPVVIAPTALAAYRAAENTIAESTAKTLHRYAAIFSDESDLIVEPKIKDLPKDSPGLVIVDECSMLSPVMLNKLLKRISNDTKLVFAGDPNQLPPIGADGTFASMIRLADKDDIGKHVHLAENYRNGEGVIQAAQALLSNKPIPETEGVNIHVCTPGNLPTKVQECIKNLGGVDASQTMVLAPYRSKGLGTIALNTALTRRYGSGKLVPGTRLMVGDPVIAKRNDYLSGGIPRPSIIRKLRTDRKDVFNGMKGYITAYDSLTRTATIDYYSGLKGERIYRIEELAYYIEPAYAMTVHKAQGGQAKNIILVLDVAMNNKNLIYTAITRCQEGGQIHIFTKKEFLDAPYLQPEIISEYAVNHCLTKFRYRVLHDKPKPKKN